MDVCKLYGVIPKRISDKKILLLLQLIIEYFDAKIQNVEESNCCYSWLIYVEKKEYQRGDEEYPLCGTGWTLRQAVLSFISDMDVWDELEGEIQELLSWKWERIVRSYWRMFTGWM